MLLFRRLGLRVRPGIAVVSSPSRSACTRGTPSSAQAAGSSTSAGPASNAPPPVVRFQLHHLPPQLQREFDAAANERALRYLARHRHAEHLPSAGCPVAAPAAVEVAVTPATVDKVVWRCERCRTQWTARPAERTDPQTSDAHRCPSCYGDADSVPASAPMKLDAEATQRAAPEGSARAVPSRLLCETHPALAAQWDTQRNAILTNRVVQDVTEVRCSSSASVWWRCALCRTPWRESVSSRVGRYEVQRHGADPSAEEAVAALLCPACERRGATVPGRQSDGKSSAAAVRRPRRVLADDPLLLAEALLTPSQSPLEVALTGETMLQWRCRTCQTEFAATVANRFLRHERCPQCSGRERSAMNLLAIQRPDVLAEVSKHISRTRLRHVTVHDDVELPFVCRTCFSPYRMTARSRCAVPKGVPACSKCFLTSTQVLAEAQQELRQRGAVHLNARARKRVRQKAMQLSRSQRSSDKLAATANELSHRDGAVKD